MLRYKGTKKYRNLICLFCSKEILIKKVLQIAFYKFFDYYGMTSTMAD